MRFDLIINLSLFLYEISLNFVCNNLLILFVIFSLNKNYFSYFNSLNYTNGMKLSKSKGTKLTKK
jgi:hypothetical protein